MTRPTQKARIHRKTWLFVESLEPRRLLSASRNTFSTADISVTNHSQQGQHTNLVRSLNDEASRLHDNRSNNSRHQTKIQEKVREARNDFHNRSNRGSDNRIRFSLVSNNNSNGTERKPSQAFPSASSLAISSIPNSQPQQRTLLQNAVAPIERGSSEPSIATRLAPLSIDLPNFGLPTLTTVSFLEADDSTSPTNFSRSRTRATFMAPTTDQTIDTDDEEDEEETLQPNQSEFDALGGLINLDQMPKLADTLPTIGDDVSPLVLSDVDVELDVETKGNNEVEHDDIATLQKSSKGSVAKIAPTEYQHDLPAPETRWNEKQDQNAIDELFATEQFADTMEEFGGLVAMPAELPSRNRHRNEVSFDSIVPKPPRIDQIITRTPIVEVGEETPRSPDDKPVSINIRAGIPATLLLLPSLRRRRKHDKTTQDAMGTNLKKGFSQ